MIRTQTKNFRIELDAGDVTIRARNGDVSRGRWRGFPARLVGVALPVADLNAITEALQAAIDRRAEQAKQRTFT